MIIAIAPIVRRICAGKILQLFSILLSTSLKYKAAKPHETKWIAKIKGWKNKNASSKRPRVTNRRIASCLFKLVFWRTYTTTAVIARKATAMSIRATSIVFSSFFSTKSFQTKRKWLEYQHSSHRIISQLYIKLQLFIHISAYFILNVIPHML